MLITVGKRLSLSKRKPLTCSTHQKRKTILVLFVEVVEMDKNQQSRFIGSHEGTKQNEEHEAQHQHDNDAIQHSTSFSIPWWLTTLKPPLMLYSIQPKSL
ncbi:hypothetical protein QL285_005883 [Trifolium repens]|nr:hypothetical protein QL285_005883 [Trifolium repens]